MISVNGHYLKASIIVIAVLALLFMTASAAASAFVEKVIIIPAIPKADSTAKISGESPPSNSTRANCEVLININNGTYQKTDPVRPGDFTKWSYTMHVSAGDNKATLKFECFDPKTNITNFVYHHSYFVTGTKS